MKTRLKIRPKNPGFALIVTLSLMILLTIIAVGLLSLSSISLRSASRESAVATARANARMALMLALGELQKAAGDDRRITADGSIFAGAAQPNVLGVWNSWSPKQGEAPTKSAPDYTNEKTKNFRTWLVSNNNPDPLVLKDPNWAKGGTLADSTQLFSIAKNGFDLAGSKVKIMPTTSTAGAMAWVISQDATKAKINVAGPEDDLLTNNVQVQAQARPSLGLTTKFNNPTADWNQRAQRVVSLSQATLDPALYKGDPTIQPGSDFTTQGFGLLTDVVNGGLKTDLSLGFELSDADFTTDQWAGDPKPFKNPFRLASVPAFGSFPSYKGERMLFKPLNPAGTLTANLGFDPANVLFEFPVAAVPTFATLRSFYRTPYHLYNTADGITVFERGSDHVALSQRAPSTNRSPFSPPGAIPKALKSQTGYRPILDRIMFVLSAYVAPDLKPRLVVTPIITLWNPYNVALEIEGAIAYPWIDFPYQLDWTWGGVKRGVAMSRLLGAQFQNQSHGRSVNPYFFAALTSNGLPNAEDPIRFQPGQVMVFAPSPLQRTEFLAAGSVRARTVFLQPANTPDKLSARGGFAIPMKNSFGQGFEDKVSSGPVTVTLTPSGGDYPFFITLEDATRTKGPNPSNNDRGEIIGDVQTAILTGRGSALNKTITRTYPITDLKVEPQPFGVIETYHRTAKDSASGTRADLVFTNNPRQQFMNKYVAQGSFAISPHYDNKLRAISSLGGVIESLDGSSFYGVSNTSAGKTHLSFFEVPRSPMLSLAAFQHADLSSSSYAPANQFGNSWASAYVKRTQAASQKNSNGVNNLPAYDSSYLTNEALWDSFFFSGAAPELTLTDRKGSSSQWNRLNPTIPQDSDIIADFVKNPQQSPLKNSRLQLHRGTLGEAELIADLQSPSGCVKIAAHLLTDGAFNINSTNVDAWAAVIGGLREKTFVVKDGTSPTSGTAFPRFRDPVGIENDKWQGFRALTDDQVKALATNIVNEVRLRGPFLSLSEFVNRRLESSALGLKGALQSAIDATNTNEDALFDSIDNNDLGNYPERANVDPPKTGVGIPGYLTQADLLQSIASVIIPRSDTFTIRAYGEARDKSGNVLAKVICEAVVQRTPDFVDQSNKPSTAMADLSPINTTFGRRFSIVSFRYLSPSET